MKFLDKKSYRDNNGIAYYLGKDYKALRVVTSIQKNIRDSLISSAVEGVTTNYLNNLANKLIKSFRAEPLFLGYGGFPNSICASVNDQVVHGVCSDYKLKKGDIFSLDLGVKLNGYCADSCRTIVIGNNYNNDNDKVLVETCEKAFWNGFKKALPGNTLGDVGFEILKTVVSIRTESGTNLLDICESFTGHGIGHSLHEKPSVLNFGKPGYDLVLKEGMCICIEPVVKYKTSDIIKKDNDLFTYFTSDKKATAHYENQVYISKDGPVLLT